MKHRESTKPEYTQSEIRKMSLAAFVKTYINRPKAFVASRKRVRLGRK